MNADDKSPLVTAEEATPPLPATEENSPKLEKQRWTPYLVFCNISVVLGSSLAYGYNLGVINAPVNAMTAYLNESFQRSGQTLSEDELNFQWSLVVTLYLIGGFLGSIWVPNVLASALGKRNSLLVSTGIGAVGAAVLFATPWTGSYYPLFIGRAIVGYQGGLDMIIAPDLIGEHAPARLRGGCGSLFTIGCPLGVVLANLLGMEFVLGNESYWNYLFLGLLGFYIIHGTCLLFVTESPFHFIDKQNDEGAIRSLMKLRGANEDEVQAELRETKDIMDSEMLMCTMSITAALTYRQIWWPMIIVIQLGIVGEMTGLTAVAFYATKVMEDGGLNDNTAALANLGLSVIQAIAVVVNIFIIDRLGRRIMMLAPLFAVSVANAMLIASISFGTFQLGIAGFALFSYAYASGPGILPLYMTAEMFPQPAKPLAYTVGMFTNWCAAIAMSFAFPELQLHFDQYSFLPFIAISFFEFVFFLFFLPETSDRLVDYDPDRFAPGHSLLQLKRSSKRSSAPLRVPSIQASL